MRQWDEDNAQENPKLFALAFNAPLPIDYNDFDLWQDFTRKQDGRWVWSAEMTYLSYFNDSAEVKKVVQANIEWGVAEKSLTFTIPWSESGHRIRKKRILKNTAFSGLLRRRPYMLNILTIFVKVFDMECFKIDPNNSSHALSVWIADENVSLQVDYHSNKETHSQIR